MGTKFKVNITPKYKTVCSDGDFIIGTNVSASIFLFTTGSSHANGR
jgi:hypothetical protein